MNLANSIRAIEESAPDCVGGVALVLFDKEGAPINGTAIPMPADLTTAFQYLKLSAARLQIAYDNEQNAVDMVAVLNEMQLDVGAAASEGI